MGTRPPWMGIGWLAVGSLLLTLGGGSVAAPAGYLARTGPTPLRFEAPRRLQTSALPPLRANDDSSPAANEKPMTPDSTLSGPLNDAVASGTPFRATTAAPNDTVSLAEPIVPVAPIESLISAGSTNVPLVLTPQMLISFFKPLAAGTNGASACVMVPVQFVPPAPVEPPSSRATYSVR